MLKVLIADDEQLICRMIQKMIDWEGKGLELAGMAENGLEVLDKIETLKPDIVITDIRMPGLDGLEMIREAMNRSQQLDFIIISGYRNFEYAHQALTLGVRHYLLKPIDENELSDTLDRIIAERRKTQADEESAEEMKAQRETQRRSVRQHFLNSILRGSRITPEEEELSETELLEFRDARYLAFIVKADWTEEGEIAAGLLEILLALIEKEESEWGCEFVNTQVKSGIISVINYPAGAKEAHPEDMEQVFTKCRKEMDKFAGYSVTFGVGTEKDDISKAGETIDEAVKAVKCRIRKGIDRVIYYDPALRRADMGALFPAVERAGTRRAVEAVDYEAVKSDFDMVTERLMEDVRHSPLDVFEVIEAFTGLILEVLKENGVREALLTEFRGHVDLLMDQEHDRSRHESPVPRGDQ